MTLDLFRAGDVLRAAPANLPPPPPPHPPTSPSGAELLFLVRCPTPCPAVKQNEKKKIHVSMQPMKQPRKNDRASASFFFSFLDHGLGCEGRSEKDSSHLNQREGTFFPFFFSLCLIVGGGVQHFVIPVPHSHLLFLALVHHAHETKQRSRRHSHPHSFHIRPFVLPFFFFLTFIFFRHNRS